MSKWKPGQLVTIDNKVYRVKRVRNPLGIVFCEIQCSIWKNYKSGKSDNPPSICNNICYNTNPKLVEDGLYLKQVYPKRI